MGSNGKVASLSEAASAALIVAFNESGMSRSDFARQIERSPGYVTKVLRGEHNFTMNTFEELMQALGQSVALNVTASN